MDTDYRIAVDIGGTFTDVAYLAPDGTLATHKLLSTPSDYADAVIAGIGALLRDQGLLGRHVQQVLHGCTVATNAILEHKGARTALITTKGFRDVLELRRTRVPLLYEPLYQKPPPLVPRHLRFEVTERMDAGGNVVTPLDTDDLDSTVAALQRSEVEAVAVCLLHSYANTSHEAAIGRALRDSLPDCFISLSTDILPQMREYERTSTTVINSYVGPPVRKYLQSMLDKLSAAGIGGRLMVMQSSGGILDATAVLNRPAQIVECGPAAGVIGAAAIGRLSDHPNLISFDMGGTTAKVSLIERGNHSISTDYEVAGGQSGSAASPLVNGGGYALKLPVIDIVEVGAGGGSIVWIDKAGLTKVGPQSAGAMPGPACYRAGGQQPTVTDANVVLGYLNPEAIADGTVPIDASLARQVIQQHVADPLGRPLMETALGIHNVANANMMRAIKAVTTYRGRDPRDFTLMAFGGSGGMHAVALARQLQIQRVIVPPAAGVFSALGLLLADVELNISTAFLRPTTAMCDDDVEQLYQRIEHEIAQTMGENHGKVHFKRMADIRYMGQAFELTIPLPDGPIDQQAVAELATRFAAEHERRYGHSFTGEYPLETVNLRVVGTVESQDAAIPRAVRAASATGTTTRSAFFGDPFGTIDSPVLRRDALDSQPLSGPAIIEEYEGTVVVPPDCQVGIDAHGNILIELQY